MGQNPYILHIAGGGHDLKGHVIPGCATNIIHYNSVSKDVHDTNRFKRI